jgi:choline dehydrogenase-like flavoprotein
MSEQQPNQDSRIGLMSRRDRTGLPLPELDWRVGGRDFADARRTIELLAEEVERLGLGRIESLWDRGADRPDVVTGGWHHMGTTAMSVTAETGVVDRDCRVHGLENLYVAGSSVFPTSGYANPTLTLLALAVRLGRHLGGVATAS